MSRWMFSRLEMDCIGHAWGFQQTTNGSECGKHQDFYQPITNHQFLMHIDYNHLCIFKFLNVLDLRMLKKSLSCAQILIRQKQMKKRWKTTIQKQNQLLYEWLHRKQPSFHRTVWSSCIRRNEKSFCGLGFSESIKHVCQRSFFYQRFYLTESNKYRTISCHIFFK